ncbi:MAG: hypothetical protein FWC11_06635 [Firmicutes bacterium]|nr:hypothetical protein [Bacillota bacterium]
MIRVFDPFDVECECKHNPTKQLKNVDNGFSPSVGEFLVKEISHKSILDA